MRERDFGSRRKLIGVGVNLLLLSGVIYLVGQRLWRGELVLPAGYRESAGDLLKLIGGEGRDKEDLQLIFIFDRLPYEREFEVVEKLSIKVRGQAGVFALFNRLFRSDRELLFAHRFIWKRVKAERVGRGGVYFLVVKGGLVEYSSVVRRGEEFFGVVGRYLRGGLGDREFPYEVERRRILGRLRGGGVRLYNLGSGVEEDLILGKGGEVEVIHGDCVGCGLERMRRELKERDCVGRVVIFSYLASGIVLKGLVDWAGLTGRYYYDWRDELDLAFGFWGRYRYNGEEMKEER